MLHWPGARVRAIISSIKNQAPGYGMKYEVFGREALVEIASRYGVDRELRDELDAVARVFPLRANNHVLENLIDWDAVPDDPIFKLVFPQPGMLPPETRRMLRDAIAREEEPGVLAQLVREIRLSLNPHPADQTTLNIPSLHEEEIEGVQHKYRETALFFPSQGQTCHAYCTYCFRWAQFVDLPEFKIASREVSRLVALLREDHAITDVLITGGDPLIMRTRLLERYIEPLLAVDSLRTIRIGTKALGWWPARFTHDRDADDLLALFERVIDAGKHLAIMAHVTHPQELAPSITREAIARIQRSGAIIRTQSPIVKNINDDKEIWASMWREQVNLGMIPYYMFIPRDTGARHHFAVTLADAHAIYRDAIAQVSGLARTARGPSMSTSPGKVCVKGVARVAGEEVFVLEFLQARDPELVGRPFFAKMNREATWLDELEPAFEEPRFFFR